MIATVTGASGHLGGNLVRALVSRGWKVRALVHHDTRAIDGLNLEIVEGDVLYDEHLRRAFRGVDVVFHLAAHISVINRDRKQVEAININGVQNVIDSCFAEGVKRLVYTSSFHAHEQEPLEEPFDESRPLCDSGKLPPYNRSKAEGERLIQAAISNGLDAIIIIPVGIIGPYDFNPSHFGAILLAMARGKLPVIVNAGLDWVDARDVADGMINACQLSKYGESYILSGHRSSLKDIARQASKITGKNPPKIVLPFWMAKSSAPFVEAVDRIRKKRPLFTSISIKELDSNKSVSHAKASRELGYQPRPLQDTIADTIEWFKLNGFLNSTKQE
ncbi:MAG: NAD-dependent epimerase/dehydratase family protein [Chloroflexi bacterium]|nr:NAD-dependent epimerase/dehydratase family protein [Chloroflexota bacterium]